MYTILCSKTPQSELHPVMAATVRYAVHIISPFGGIPPSTQVCTLTNNGLLVNWYKTLSSQCLKTHDFILKDLKSPNVLIFSHLDFGNNDIFDPPPDWFFVALVTSCEVWLIGKELYRPRTILQDRGEYTNTVGSHIQNIVHQQRKYP